MSKKLVIGKFLDVDSFFHRVSPLTKTLIFFITSGFIIFNENLHEYFLFSFVLLLGVTFSKIGLKNFLTTIKPIMMIFLWTFIFQLIFNHQGDVIFQYKFIKIYSSIITITTVVFFRMFILIGVSSILTLSTSPTEITHGLEDVLKPLKVVKFPSETLALILSISLRFIPLFFDEVERIRVAQVSKGYDVDELKFFSKFKYYGILLIPLLLSSVQRADEVASAMEIRSYGSKNKKTRFRKYTFSKEDIVLITLFIGLLVANFFI